VVAQLAGIFQLNLRCGGSVGWDILTHFEGCVGAQLVGIGMYSI
jgi:hypothetical protein